MPENKYYFKIYEKWRNKLNIILVIFAFLIFIIEVLFFFIYYKHDANLVNGLSKKRYLLYFLGYPSFMNFFICINAYIINKNEKLSWRFKNYFMSISLVFLAGNTLAIHYVFSPLLCLVCLPIFLTTIFSDVKLTSTSTAITLLFLIIALLKSTGNYFLKDISGFFKEDPNLLYNYCIALVGLISSFISSSIMIHYQHQKNIEVIDNFKKQDELTKLLKLDSLTKLYNHSSIYEIIEETLKNASAFESITLAMLDIDNFKAVNDTFGHIHGDEVITTIANLLNKYSSDDVICSRYGGEEFAILFTNYNVEKANQFINKIRQELASTVFDFIKNKDYKITFSSGLAQLNNSTTTPSEFFSYADVALYEAKKIGKNCTIIYAENTPTTP